MLEGGTIILHSKEEGTDGKSILRGEKRSITVEDGRAISGKEDRSCGKKQVS